MLTQKELKEILTYDCNSGIFIWNVKISRKNNIGDKAGHFHKETGYIRITIRGKQYQAHRLAWLYITGEWPKNEIDHDNRIRHDNKWKNLKDVTSKINKINKVKYYDNLSGLIQGFLSFS